MASNDSPLSENFPHNSISTETIVTLTEKLEALVKCPIHLGILENPIMLSCQHAFCYDCIKKYMSVNTDLICPICKRKEATSNIDGLQPSFLNKELIDLLMEQRVQSYTNELIHEIPLTDERKEELVRHLQKEIDLNKSGDSIPPLNSSQLDSDNGTTSLLDKMDDYKYKVVKKHKVNIILKMVSEKTNKTFQLNLSVFDINPVKNQLILVDSFTNELIYYSDCDFRTFCISLCEGIVKPEYIRFYQDDLIITGRFKRNGTIFSCFLRCDTYGKIVQKSEFYPWNELSGRPMMTGFDINEKTGDFYICMTESENVVIFDTSFVESKSFHFDGNHPEYIAFSFSSNQLWISCPENREILIFNIESQIYKTINTQFTVPMMISVINDRKTIYLDTANNRLIWINRKEANIANRNLDIHSLKSEDKIHAFVTPSSSLIAVSTDHEIMMLQSEQCFSRYRQMYETCRNFIKSNARSLLTF